MKTYQIYYRKNRSEQKHEATYAGKPMIVHAPNKREAVNLACAKLPNYWLSAKPLSK